MNEPEKVKSYRMQDWYPALSSVSFPTVFVPLSQGEIEALAAGEENSAAVKAFLPKLRNAIRNLPRPRFISVDAIAPVDTARFRDKRGAVSSPESAWNVLTGSVSVRAAAAAGKVSCICIRPFRRMDVPREFRLFIKDGKLAGMSQYWLVRHFRRLIGRKEEYLKKALDFTRGIEPYLPDKDIVADIYITHLRRFILIDLNPWGAPTDPKMFDWAREWKTDIPAYGIVPPPHRISGEVEVKF